MARFEGHIITDDDGRIGLRADGVVSMAGRNHVDKTTDGVVSVIMSSPSGTVEIRMGRSRDGDYVDIWTSHEHEDVSHRIKTCIYSGLVKAFCSTKEALVLRLAREQLESEYATRD